MKVKTVQILWHNKQPIYTADFEPAGSRLATGGADSTIRIWKLVKSENGAGVEFLSTLKRHSAPVNCIRWSPNGNWVFVIKRENLGFWWGWYAMIYDRLDGTILLWSLHENLEQDEDGSTSDISDLAWSPDGNYIISACLDNTARIFSVPERKKVRAGVAWDPKQEYLITQSNDRYVCGSQHRSVSIFSFSVPKPGVFNAKHLSKQYKLPLSLLYSKKVSDLPETPGIKKTVRMYHDESLLSFFRRPWFSPDGSLLLTPTGQVPKLENIEQCKDEDTENCVLMFSRGSLLKQPVAILGPHKKPSVAIRWNPIRFKLTKEEPLIRLPYRYVYAIATQDSVYLYDTQQRQPLAYLSQLHYSTFTDLTWSPDGLTLFMTSTDGFGSLAVFEPGELGEPCLDFISEMSENIEMSENVEKPMEITNHTIEKENQIKPIKPVEFLNDSVKKRRIEPILISK